MTTRVRVVIADDDPRVRHDFTELLELEPDIEVIAAAADGETAVELCLRLQPDVVVMDVRMPRQNGIDATRLLRTQCTTSCRVLVMTTFDLDDYVLGAVHAGASGFLLKDRAVETLADAVRTVAAGEAIVAPRATARLLAELVTPGATSSGVSHPLTDRELAVVQLLARGLSNDDIAAAAMISRATVKTHVSNVLTKLGLTSRIQIVVWAYEHGWTASATQHPPPQRT